MPDNIKHFGSSSVCAKHRAVAAASEIDITICNRADSFEWNGFIHDYPGANVCHLFQWYSVIREAYGHQPIYLMARRGLVTQGVLPLFRVKSRIFGRSLTSMPFLDYGGACALSSEITQALITHALGLLEGAGADYLELRQCDPPAPNVASRLDKVSMVLDLSPGIEGIWQQLPAKVRNQVRKAEKAGLRISFGGPEFLSEFYPVFAVNMRDLGSPVHDSDFFSHIFKRFGSQAKLAIIRDGNYPIGGLVALYFKDTVVVPWASSLREYFPKCPNNLLYWEMIKYSCKRGCKRFDFGRSSLNSGTYHFKRQWGAKPMQIYWQILGAEMNPPATNARNNAKLQLASKIWQKLPLPVTTFIGPRLRKYITE